MMTKNNSDKYEILRQLAVAGARGEKLQSAVKAALEQAGRLVGLTACSMTLWDTDMSITLAVAWAIDPGAESNLSECEKQTLSKLRKEQKLLSAFLTFDTDPPIRAFTLPLKHGQKTFGAVFGALTGDASLISEELFLEALSAALTLKVVADGLTETGETTTQLLDKQRSRAISETAVAVNHEINNPLTAILGNVQLLLMNPESLDQELIGKLRTIEAAAMKIRDVTKKLLTASSSRTVEYGNGTNMIDLSDSDQNQ